MTTTSMRATGTSSSWSLTARPRPRPLASSPASACAKGPGSHGTIQPAILTLQGDFDNLVEGATLEAICNVGAAGLSTGEEEGWVLEGTRYGTFMPLSPIIGITHLSVAGERIFAHD